MREEPGAGGIAFPFVREGKGRRGTGHPPGVSLPPRSRIRRGFKVCKALPEERP
ncbi:hypothetical protein B4135_4099 [Caldibacillus debilis]|uniref:Uncharacterized protein n=1 Tax=Caldibacillus debilis TaxID=301148 RepID=A0A150L9K4_9BACI|nr:hypothetical protein B4135_4099 [Caldibacillus debilis]